ncbi:MAG: hypothetical protein ACRDRL_16285 [Sciscionella sp.]
MAVNQLANPALAFPGPVTPGNVLLAVVFGAGFGVPPQAGVASAVSDSVNGSWGTAQHNSGNQHDASSHNWSFAWWLLPSTAAGTPTVTATVGAGQNGTTLIIAELPADVFDVAGNVDAITGDVSGDCTTPPPSSGATAGAAVFALLGGYVPSTAVALVTAGWNIAQNSDSAGAATGTAAGLLAWRTAAAGAGELPQLTASGYFAGATGWAGATFTLKAASPPPPPPPSTLRDVADRPRHHRRLDRARR